MSENKQVWAWGGESLSAPEDTFPAYWGALATGADGLAIDVQLSSDGGVVCCGRATLEATCGDPRTVASVTVKELRRLDAGSQFRSTLLDEENRPVGQGDDTPWEGLKRKQVALYHPALDEVLLYFARRTRLLVRLVVPAEAGEDARQRLVDGVLALLRRFGISGGALVAGDARTLRAVRKASKQTLLAMVAASGHTPAAAAKSAAALGACRLLIDAEQVASPTGRVAAGLAAALGRKVSLLLTSTAMLWASSPGIYRALADKPWVAGFVARGVLQTRALGTLPCLVVQDDFVGAEVNLGYWVMGYSKVNQDTQICQDDGVVIQIKEGGQYSGAAAVTCFPIRGDFDAQVAFEVASPNQGTTFEMSAIQVDPGYHYMDSAKLDGRSVNLTFDVHGAPPYASSERDENDGFRIGWNNGPAVTEFVQHAAQSSNIYNKYSRDVGDGTASNPSGRLRLVRHGELFAAFYTDKHNEAWVLSGAAMVPTLCQDVFLRLGAKHWPKKGKTPPPNRVRFSRFRLYQW